MKYQEENSMRDYDEIRKDVTRDVCLLLHEENERQNKRANFRTTLSILGSGTVAIVREVVDHFFTHH